MFATHDKLPYALQAQEAESSVVGSILLDRNMVEPVADRITELDFLDEKLGALFGLILNLHATKRPVDDVHVLAKYLREAQIFESPLKEVAKLIQAVGHPSHAVHYAMQVLEAANRRRLADTAKELYRRITSSESDAMQTAAWTQEKCRTIAAAIDVDRVHHVGVSARSALDKIKHAVDAKYDVGVRIGIESLDDMTGGLFPTDLTILAARPSIGKSALATQVALQAGRRGQVAMLSSLEMTDEDTSVRLMSAATGIEVRQIRSGLLNDDQLARLELSASDLLQPAFYLANHRKCKISHICAAARMQKATTGLSLLVVDYLNRIAGDHYRDSRAEQLSQITNDLKDLATELKIAVLALCQLNRDAEGKKPALSNLKDSGSIEENADNVWLLHRESRDSQIASLEIAKARNGSVGEIALGFDASRVEFCEPIVEHTNF